MNSSAVRAVITCDIVGSRAFAAAEWRALQGRIKDALADVNNRFRADLLREFTITLDDEFQGVLTAPDQSYAIVVHLQDHVPVEFRCGIGIGTIELLVPAITEMRGEAFFRSREALELAKRAGCAVIIKSTEAENDLMDDTINAMVELITAIQSTWTARQREVARFYRSHPGLTYREIAEEFGVSKQTISQIVHAAQWKRVANGEQVIRRLLKVLATAHREA